MASTRSSRMTPAGSAGAASLPEAAPRPARHCMRRMNSAKVRSGSSWRGANRLSRPVSATAASSEISREAAYWPSTCRVA
ncbi:hypothetical protein G6F40_018164 [Rhizopus arrhizus]|nr:hypothetical protein G6F40_018164 [Rhizopus arrhizus]